MDAGTDAGTDAGPPPGIAPCDPDAGPAPDPSLGLTNACTEALILSGFGLRFTEGARRLGRFEVYPRTDSDTAGCAASAAFRTASLVGQLGGGSEPADGLLRASYFTVGAAMDRERTDGGAGPFPSVRVAREVLTLRMDGPEVTVERPFDLVSAGLAGAPAVAVVLDGVALDTDLTQSIDFPSSVDPAGGYPLARLGVSLGDVTRVGDEILFEVTGRYAPGKTGDSALDRAAELAVVDLSVRYAVVALEREPTLGTIAYRMQHQPEGEEPGSVCRPDAARSAVTIAGPPAEHALAALRAFELATFPDEDAGEGVRVRELSVLVLDFQHDPASGEGTMRVEGYLSNEGVPAPRREIDYAFEATVAQLSWDGPGAVETLRIDGPVSSGRAELSLPLTE